jgi:aryl-alcohol dehydrogenase-like predicted oxidoreductase
MNHMNRREFMNATCKGGVLGAAAWAVGCPERLLAASKDEIPRRKLGKTGLKVSVIGLGGWHIGTQKDPEESIRLIHAALDGGMNFLDNSHDYNEGQSEIRMGRAIQGRRDKVVLMTKFNSRDKKGAMRELEESLRRLRTDYIDIWQFHSIERAQDPDWIFSPNGSIEAAALAKRQGKVRFVGFTGHKHPDYHIGMLKKQFEWDTIQMPLNILDAHYRSFEINVLPIAIKRKMGIIGMKPLAFHTALQVAPAIQCLHYAMSLPVSVTITGCETMERVEQALQAGQTFKQWKKKEMAAMRSRSRDFGQDGRGEPFKTTADFDNKPSAEPPPYEA